MVEYYVFNTETGDELYNSSKISECRLYAKLYSKRFNIPCTISVVFHEEHYINGKKSEEC